MYNLSYDTMIVDGYDVIDDIFMNVQDLTFLLITKIS